MCFDGCGLRFFDTLAINSELDSNSSGARPAKRWRRRDKMFALEGKDLGHSQALLLDMRPGKKQGLCVFLEYLRVLIPTNFPCVVTL